MLKWNDRGIQEVKPLLFGNSTNQIVGQQNFATG